MKKNWERNEDTLNTMLDTYGSFKAHERPTVAQAESDLERKIAEWSAIYCVQKGRQR